MLRLVSSLLSEHELFKLTLMSSMASTTAFRLFTSLRREANLPTDCGFAEYSCMRSTVRFTFPIIVSTRQSYLRLSTSYRGV